MIGGGEIDITEELAKIQDPMIALLLKIIWGRLSNLEGKFNWLLTAAVVGSVSACGSLVLALLARVQFH